MIKIFFTKMEKAKMHSEDYVKEVLREYLNVNKSSIEICKNEFGKPYLRSSPNLYFNISHTKGAIVCAVSDEPVGVDIERIKNFNKRIPELFFTHEEQNYIFADKNEQNKRFVEVWIMKEAYLKWRGKGIEITGKSFNVLENKKISIFSRGIYCIAVCGNNCSQFLSVIDYDYLK